MNVEVKMLTSVAGQGFSRAPGEVLELDEDTAGRYVRQNFAEYADQSKAFDPSANQVIETAMVEPGSEARTDRDGTVFDPAIHAADENGNPKLTTKGRFRKKPGRRSS